MSLLAADLIYPDGYQINIDPLIKQMTFATGERGFEDGELVLTAFPRPWVDRIYRQRTAPILQIQSGGQTAYHGFIEETYINETELTLRSSGMWRLVAAFTLTTANYGALPESIIDTYWSSVQSRNPAYLADDWVKTFGGSSPFSINRNSASYTELTKVLENIVADTGYQARMWEDGALYFGPDRSRVWVARSDRFEFGYSYVSFVNEVVYSYNGGANAEVESSVSPHGINRRRYVDLDFETSGGIAENIAEIELARVNSRSDLASQEILSLHTPYSGYVRDLWLVRAGDILRIYQNPYDEPGSGPFTDFLINRTRYSAHNHKLELYLAEQPPSLETLLEAAL